MNAVIKAAGKLQAFCASQSWHFCFIGGVSLQVWGQPRETVDAHLTLLTGFGEEKRFIDKLLSQFAPRIDNAADFALKNRVLLLKSEDGVGLDIVLGVLPFEELAVRRSCLFVFPPSVELRVCTAEDLIVMKSFAGRGQDWVDVERIIVRQGGKLDWAFIKAQLKPLAELKESPEIVDELEKRRQLLE